MATAPPTITEDVRAADLAACYSRPAGDGPLPAVVVLHEVFGLNEDVRAIAARFAGKGYAAVAPDLYSGGQPRALCIARTFLDTLRGAGSSIDRVHGARAWLAARPEVDAARIGVVGFCQGGGFALVAAVRPGFVAAAANYGRVPRRAGALSGICPVVGSYGGADTLICPPSHASRLDRALSALGVPHDVKVYPGVGHSFLNHSGSRAAGRILHAGYDATAAADAWERIFAFFARHLEPG